MDGSKTLESLVAGAINSGKPFFSVPDGDDPVLVLNRRKLPKVFCMGCFESGAKPTALSVFMKHTCMGGFYSTAKEIAKKEEQDRFERAVEEQVNIRLAESKKRSEDGKAEDSDNGNHSDSGDHGKRPRTRQRGRRQKKQRATT